MLGTDLHLARLVASTAGHHRFTVIQHDDIDGARGIRVTARREPDAMTGSGGTVLLGYSYGANLAFEAAQELSDRDTPARALVLIDSTMPETEFGVWEAARRVVRPPA